MRILSSLLFLFLVFTLFAFCKQKTATVLQKPATVVVDSTKWNPDAGVIYPYTAKIITSSNANLADKITDGDPQTFWQSAAPFPTNYISNAAQNIFLKKGDALFKHNQDNDFSKATDGDLNTATSIKKTEGKYRLSIKFSQASKCTFLGLKLGNQADVAINATGNYQTSHNLTYSKSDSYQFKNLKLGGTLEQITLTSEQPFEVFEIAGTAEYPEEYAILDFGETVSVGTVVTRHWSGEKNAVYTTLHLSNDGKKWEQVALLNASLEHSFITNLKKETSARYLKITQHLKPDDWNKVYLWEVAVYDKYGQYGAPPVAEKSNVTIRELLGVNSTWGWGHNKYSDLLKAKEGPECYAPLASHARNYHDLKWDISDPTHRPDYGKMAAGKGSEVHWWLNWDQEYAAWEKADLKTQTTLQIHNFTDSDWNDPYQNAYAIGQSFAEHFGKKSGNGMIETLEIGNEPWKYEAATYRQILLGMAKGAKATDPDLKIFPCALQAADPAMENTKIFMNYMGVRLPEAAAPYIDGLNIHCYSYLQNAENQRIAVAPEHPNSSFREIFSNVRFRDRNLPEKPIYLSEWGWDHTGGGEACTHSECVSEKAAAAYGVRGALMAMRAGIERATWFFFANEERPSSLYTRSGLTGSVKTNFQPKMAYRAFTNLIELVGDSYFLEVLQEDKNGWVYLLGNQAGTATHLIGWLPENGDSKRVENLILNKKLTSQVKAAFGTRLDGLTLQGKRVNLSLDPDNQLIVPLTAIPIVICLAQ
ncbi:MAG: hypothetical protein AB8G22_00785 [Saprospiraceae bacterium]